jgi:hypothetical protein
MDETKKDEGRRKGGTEDWKDIATNLNTSFLHMMKLCSLDFWNFLYFCTI